MTCDDDILMENGSSIDWLSNPVKTVMESLMAQGAKVCDGDTFPRVLLAFTSHSGLDPILNLDALVGHWDAIIDGTNRANNALQPDDGHGAFKVFLDGEEMFIPR